MKSKCKGLIIWGHSDCRSIMGLYRELVDQLDIPVIVVMRLGREDITGRQKIGFSHNEFEDVDMIVVGEDYNKCLSVINAHSGYRHIFSEYQRAPAYFKIMKEIVRRGEQFGVMSEAPCDMVSGVKGKIKKYLYNPFVLCRRVRSVSRMADFIINLSGDSTLPLSSLGWKDCQIIPFGYYPLPLPKSKLVCRKSNRDFHILVSGLMTWHRAPDTVIKALILLKDWGVKYRATFTQGGPMSDQLKLIAEKNCLPVEFVGLVPIDKLINLYQGCAVYVAAGRSEPWGMRINDALQCGSPIVVSSGMGAVKLVNDYGCGLSFWKDDYVDLANKLQSLAIDDKLYARCANNVAVAAEETQTCRVAKRLIEVINDRYGGWLQ